MARKKEVNPDETGQEKFRRVVDQRIKPLIARFEQITEMITQPVYDPSENDLKHVLAIITEKYEALVHQYDRAIAGTLKAKELKEYTGIDWDKELSESQDDADAV